MRLLFALAVAATCSFGCTVEQAAETDIPSEDEVRVDTSNKQARAQYDANVAFATSYKARCVASGDGFRRVLITGYGRFMSVQDNATGRIVEAAVPGLTYPWTSPVAAGNVDPPAPQLAVASKVVRLPGGEKIHLCGMILPVYWDVAAILALKEIDAFVPDLVVMNGVAGSQQPLWIELGAMNRAGADLDGSGKVLPKTGKAGTAALIPGAPLARANLLSWEPVRAAAVAEIKAQAALDSAFGETLSGAVYAGFPRESNDYLCNNITYTVGYLMDSPKKVVTLLQASTKSSSKPNSVPFSMAGDFRTTPRVFVHWPSALAAHGAAGGASVLLHMLEAQLAALRGGALPTRGDNAKAEPGLEGGNTF